MKIVLNGKITDVPDQVTASELIELFDFGGKRIALEVNEEIVTRTEYEQYTLKDNDHVEIVQAIGGG